MNDKTTFSYCVSDLEIANNVQKIIQNILETQTKLETLTCSYKKAFLSSGTSLTSLFHSENNSTKNETLQKYLQDIATHVTEIERSIDIKRAGELVLELINAYDIFEHKYIQVSAQSNILEVFRKKIIIFSRESQLRLNEYCYRMMVMAAEHESLKRSFDHNINLEMDRMRKDFTEIMRSSFQKNRVQKLKQFVEILDSANSKASCKHVDDYKFIINKRQELADTILNSENKLRSWHFKGRKLPFHRMESITALKRSLTSRTKMLEKLRVTTSKLENSIIWNGKLAEQTRKTVNIMLAETLRKNFQIQSRICQLTRKAVLKKLLAPHEMIFFQCNNFFPQL